MTIAIPLQSDFFFFPHIDIGTHAKEPTDWRQESQVHVRMNSLIAGKTR